MHIKEFLYKNDGLEVSDIAEAAGLPRVTISMILHGHRNPRKKTMEKITKCTQGLVTEMDQKKFFHEMQKNRIVNRDKKKSPLVSII
jgi:transcriptional regulator with XRE-family HTH domain